MLSFVFQPMCNIRRRAKQDNSASLRDSFGMRIDEELKASDALKWVAEMNNIEASAEEVVLRATGFFINRIQLALT